MPAIYLCNVVGTGTRRDPLRASVADVAAGVTTALMIDDGPRRRAIVWSDDVVVSGPGITLLRQAASRQALIDLLTTTNPTNPQRNVVANWLTSNGYVALPGAATSWLDVILFACRQVNPVVDLSVLA